MNLGPETLRALSEKMEFAIEFVRTPGEMASYAYMYAADVHAHADAWQKREQYIKSLEGAQMANYIVALQGGRG